MYNCTYSPNPVAKGKMMNDDTCLAYQRWARLIDIDNIVNIIDNILDLEYWKAQQNDLEFEIEYWKANI